MRNTGYMLVAVLIVAISLGVGLIFLNKSSTSDKEQYSCGYCSSSKGTGRMLEITPGKLCKGGEYMSRGNSERAKMCRKLASSESGMAEIQRYDCGAGYHGMPGNRFRFTPMDRRCDEHRHSGEDSESDDEKDTSRVSCMENVVGSEGIF